MPLLARLGVVALLLGAAAACGTDADLPPGDDEGLAEVFQPFFEPLGIEFTYGGVVKYRKGDHLQLYVEPTGPATDEQYLDRLLRSSATIVPYVFGEYDDLESFDLCQEPIPSGPGDPDKPEPRTVVLLTRAQADSVADWSSATLADLIRASRTGKGGEIRVDEAIAKLPAYVDAVEQAEAAAGPAGPPGY